MPDPEESYDRVAAEYATEFRDELSHKPFDRKMLDWLIEKVGGLGPICDMGCGPGQVAKYLHEKGSQACGIDLSGEMVRQAQLLNPEIRFEQGNMLSLEIDQNSLGGIAAFYSLIHVPRESVVQALTEFKQVLRSGGAILIAHHIGADVVHRDEWFGKDVSLDFLFFETNEMKEYVTRSGLLLEEVIERDPYPAVEYPSRRSYMFARKR
jgi:SAM-dependent methyltransferase